MPDLPSLRVQALRSPKTIRSQCGRVLDLAKAGKTPHFAIDETRLSFVADLVTSATRAAYPTLDVPFHARWRHFGVGGVDRQGELEAKLALDASVSARAKVDLAVVSVLLDAGAGPLWSYREGGQQFARAEGLAVASFRMFMACAFASNKSALRVDADGLQALTVEHLASGFQVTASNPLVGLEGRVALLQGLGRALRSRPDLFGPEGRPGFLFDICARAQAGRQNVSAADLLGTVLEGFAPIWPGRVALDGQNMGDVWPYAPLESSGESLVPFHKLSQWLTYSLIEPIEAAGVKITDVGGLTGLPEYRNGGLFLDAGVLVPKAAGALEKEYTPGDEFIVEWRALTVALLDAVAPLVCERLGKSQTDFPLAKVLEGGTWAAGRKIAAEKRAGGAPPLRIVSDGTVF